MGIYGIIQEASNIGIIIQDFVTNKNNGTTKLVIDLTTSHECANYVSSFIGSVINTLPNSLNISQRLVALKCKSPISTTQIKYFSNNTQNLFYSGYDELANACLNLIFCDPNTLIGTKIVLLTDLFITIAKSMTFYKIDNCLIVTNPGAVLNDYVFFLVDRYYNINNFATHDITTIHRLVATQELIRTELANYYTFWNNKANGKNGHEIEKIENDLAIEITPFIKFLLSKNAANLSISYFCNQQSNVEFSYNFFCN